MNKWMLAVCSTLTTLTLCATAHAEDPTLPTLPTLPNVTKQALLTAAISPEKSISSVDVQELTLAPGRKGPLHLHPIPVITVIKEGTITFQIEGEAPQHLKAGDVFYEPANVRITRIDNDGDTPAKLVVLSMLGKDDHELARILSK
ncbi:MAG TPA: cupin domain-containing protein [Burkholderiaceae bacterium]|jgi:quercetin dioxygenase-like cupin family protein|nr:cupin domain-containing protein [Burkholderiaceae bacterium]